MCWALLATPGRLDVDDVPVDACLVRGERIPAVRPGRDAGADVVAKTMERTADGVALEPPVEEQRRAVGTAAVHGVDHAIQCDEDDRMPLDVDAMDAAIAELVEGGDGNPAVGGIRQLHPDVREQSVPSARPAQPALRLYAATGVGCGNSAGQVLM